MSSTAQILTILPLLEERLDSKAKALAGLAWQVGQDLSLPSIALVCGPDSLRKAAEISSFFERVYAVETPAEEEALTEGVIQALEALGQRGELRALLLAQSVAGREIAAAIAGRRDLGLLTDVQSLRATDGQIDAQLSKLDGAVNTRVRVQAGACVIFSVQVQHAIDAVNAATPGPVEALTITLPVPRIITLASTEQEQGEISLDTADIVVSGGKGLAGPEPFTGMLRELATECGAALGATRAVVDAGWVPHSWQIGQTGKTVSPRLYIALAISGQIQHRVGMQTSGTIVAVNKDAQIPLAEIADLVVVGDVFQIVPALTRLLREEKVHT